MRTIDSSRLTKDNVLNKVSQITIFSTYLNVPVEVIQDCIDNGTLILSPLRYDKNPTCGFKYDKRGKLKFRDFNGFFWGDCFDVVALIMSQIYDKRFNVANKEDFIKILRHITYMFKDIFYGTSKDINLINDIDTAINKVRSKKPIIEIVVREWNTNDIIYWNRFGVDIHYLNTHFVYPIEQFYIDRDINPQPKYYYSSKDSAYAYHLGVDRHNINNIKIYFPNRNKTETRFISNCNHIEGIFNLDKDNYDCIIITKSTKDRLAIGCYISNNTNLYSELKIGVVNIPHETYKFKDVEVDWLRSKLNTDGIFVSLMDNDKTGMLEAIYLRKKYRIKPYFIPKHLGKDFAEFFANNRNNIVKQYTNEFYADVQEIISSKIRDRQTLSLPY